MAATDPFGFEIPADEYAALQLDLDAGWEPPAPPTEADLCLDGDPESILDADLADVPF